MLLPEGGNRRRPVGLLVSSAPFSLLSAFPAQCRRQQAEDEPSGGNEDNGGTGGGSSPGLCGDDQAGERGGEADQERPPEHRAGGPGQVAGRCRRNDEQGRDQQDSYNFV